MKESGLETVDRRCSKRKVRKEKRKTTETMANLTSAVETGMPKGEQHAI